MENIDKIISAALNRTVYKELTPMETPLTETPLTDTPPVETPPTKTPATENPLLERPLTDIPPTTTPPTKTPSSKTPSSKTPATKTHLGLRFFRKNYFQLSSPRPSPSSQFSHHICTSIAWS
ncbi:hypothetical protein CC80DRAFT_549262 [Byssothecium circinans]|uniref:Uncharacterized protein n=1 Tax=Byssothecium circinans TaxID=147558 RepID=A0A6A5TSF2_9PLEO|nr:hypothetical protein CC80DRAFT_549262 [Byssothecium circinans]